MCQTKTCNTCNEIKDLNSFGSWKKKDGSRSYYKICKLCKSRIRASKMSEEEKEKRRLYQVELRRKKGCKKSKLKFKPQEQKELMKNNKFGCNTCGEIKLIEEKVKGVAKSCKSCRNKQGNEWRRKNPEKSLNISRAYRQRNLEACRERVNTYGKNMYDKYYHVDGPFRFNLIIKHI